MKGKSVTTSSASRGKRLITAIATLGLAVSAGVLGASPARAAEGTPPLEQRTPATVATADALPTVQIDSGIVWSQDMVGNIVYAGGSFSNARPAGAAKGTSLTPRGNLLAYDIRTGQLVSSWAPSVNGTVKVVKASPDGKRIYVGGSFTNASGTTKWNLAAFDATTGALITTFKAAVGGSYVNALAITDTTVYVGGLLGAGNGVTRKNLMAFNTAGALLGWAPTTDLQVDSMVLAPRSTNVIVAGRFGMVNDVSQRGLAALDLTTGAIMPWTAPSVVVNGMSTGGNKGKAGISTVTADGDAVYGTGWVYADVATGNLEGTFAAEGASGDIRWIADCHGDHYGVYSDGTTVYTTGHEHSCDSMGGYPQKDPAPGNMRNATAVTAAAKGTLRRAGVVNNIYKDWGGWPSAAPINWYPDWYTGTASGMGQAGWSITGKSDYISVGGEFVGVNGQAQYGLVRFAKVPASGADQGPRLSGDDWVPTATSVRAGSVRLSIPANWDRDDRDLTYEITRVGRSEPVGTIEQKSSFWNLPGMTFTDTGLTAGQTVSYRVKATDGDGNAATSKTVTVQVSDKAVSAYSSAVIDDGASLYYGLGTDGLIDLAGTTNGVARSGVALNAPGAISGDTGNAATFNGTSDGLVSTSASVPVSGEFSAELWFKSASNQGGKIAGYGSSQSGSSGSYDRHIYLSNSGQVVFGTYPGYTATITSPNSYNNNVWHHVLATQSGEGMKLYVDGALVGTDGATTAQSYVGFWRLGGDNINGWPNQPSSQWFNGSIDEFAVYPTALSAGAARSHFDLGTGARPPAATFASSVDDLTAAFDATGTTVADGRSIQAYAWDFGDGSPVGQGQTTTHTYAQAGDYEVKLTVTDNTGAAGTTTKPVTVKAPHARPEAVIKSDVTGLAVAFDGTDSTTSDDADIDDYAWTFGDGKTSTDAKPTHTYASAGTYDVSLTVTDSEGAVSEATTKSVTVEHADPVAAFETSTSELTVSVDASQSSASDDADLTYAWSWGDDSSDGSGKTATHTFTEPGQYDVELTVTDSLGGSDSVTKTVTVNDVDFKVKDSFDRSVSSGWGSADVGGSWSGSTSFSVSDGSGRVAVNRTQTRTALLPVESAHADSTFTVSLDKVADGGGLHVNYLVHKSSAGDLRLKLRYAANGSVNIGLAKVLGTTETMLTSKALSGYTQTAGNALNVRVQIVQNGTSSTVQAKAWAKGQTEPSAWTVTTTNGDSGLQGAGQVGFSTYGTGTITNGPVTVSIDDLTVR